MKAPVSLLLAATAVLLVALPAVADYAYNSTGTTTPDPPVYVGPTQCTLITFGGAVPWKVGYTSNATCLDGFDWTDWAASYANPVFSTGFVFANAVCDSFVNVTGPYGPLGCSTQYDCTEAYFDDMGLIGMVGIPSGRETAGQLSCPIHYIDEWDPNGCGEEGVYLGGSCGSTGDCDSGTCVSGCCAAPPSNGPGSCADDPAHWGDPLWGACSPHDTYDADSICQGRYCDTDGCCEYYDPIIIDVEGDGYSLTAPEDGVFFDMAGHGQKAKVSWTASGSDDAFLALDRNGNGRIDDATELFSNVSPGAQRAGDLSGYNALAFYDLPANGGNGDGWIDKKDAIYSKLLLWVDKNHNGVSEPSELFTLPQLGIERISLNYHQSKWTDAYGNQFRYRAQVDRDGKTGPGKDHWAYDVFLHGAK